MTVVAGDDTYKPEEDDQQVPLIQVELNNLTQDMNFSKESHLLGSHLKEKHLLAPRTMFYWYQNRKRELRQFYTFQNRSPLVYCNNIARLIKSTGLEYDAMECRLY